MKLKKTSISVLTSLMFILLTQTQSFSQETSSSERWLAPESAKGISNPVESNKSSIKKGAAIFKTRCTVCHGNEGKGDGPGGKSLNPKPADFSTDKVQNQTDGEIFWKITNGKGAMIKWEPILTEEERWQLVNFVRSLKE
ncbi:MAG: cytochrome c [Chlorobi bacterium]|nr:cytochrome c [Chlorobiota bacterium]